MKRIKKKIKNYLYKKVAPGYMEEDLFKFLPGKMDVMVDIGAHTGSFTKMFAAKVKTNKRVLIEPIPEFFSKIKSDPFFSGDILLNAAVSSAAGEAEFVVNELPETSSLLHFDNTLQETKNINKKTDRIIKVKLIKMGDVIKENNIDEIDFVKIDVQGAELEVLAGMTSELPKVKRILTEVSFKPLYQGSTTFDAVYRFLSEHGFIMIQLIPAYRGVHDELLQCDALFVNKNCYE